MNVLVIVFTVLMLLSIMTYARLQSFLGFSGIRTAYVKFMEDNERKYSNNLEQKLYATARVKASKTKKDDVPEEEYDDEEEEDLEVQNIPVGQSTPKRKPVRKLNLQPLLKGNKEGVNNPDTGPTAELFTRLIREIYGRQNFYIEAVKRNPELAPEIVATFLAQRDKPICEASVSALKDMAKVYFPTEISRDAFGKMLEGGEGIPRLSDYVLIRSAGTPIRMMGAADQLLQSIYRDPSVVEALKNRRLELINAVRSRRMKADEASKSLQQEFGQEQTTGLRPSLLDFTIPAAKGK